MCGADAEEAISPASNSCDYELIKTLVQDDFYLRPLVHLGIYTTSKIKIRVRQKNTIFLGIDDFATAIIAY